MEAVSASPIAVATGIAPTIASPSTSAPPVAAASSWALKRERPQVGWQAAHDWLRSLPLDSVVTNEQIEGWLRQNAPDLALEIVDTSHKHVVGYLSSQHRLMQYASRRKQDLDSDEKPVLSWSSLKPTGSKPRSAKWMPVYTWLKSMDRQDVVKSKEILEWMDAHPQTSAAVNAEKKRAFVISYVQKCHNRILKTKEMYSLNRITSSSVRTTQGHQLTFEDVPQHPSGYTLRGSYKTSQGRPEVLPAKETCDSQPLPAKEVSRKLELLDELEIQLRAIISESKQRPPVADPSIELDERLRGSAVDSSQLAKSAIVASTVTWSADGGTGAVLKGANLVNCVRAREVGSDGAGMKYPLRTRKFRWKWSSLMRGWDSLESPRPGPAALLRQREYSSWCASWCAYTSSGAVVLPLQRVEQAVQKVLDVRFHPLGLPQLVCSCNEAPHELLLYDLDTGRATELEGHNSQIQTVEFAYDGERIVSCATNLIKVWDPKSGACLHTMGPRPEDPSCSGHNKKISALAVAPDKSCLVATSGGAGDDKLLLWNVLSGELVAHLNAHLGEPRDDTPSMDAVSFCCQNTLMCGSDSKNSGTAVIEIWDIVTLKRTLCFPAHDLFITTVGNSPDRNTVISGSGDGTVRLFDVRTGRRVARLELGHEVTSASFSYCGTYLQASGTGNFSIVWDTRFMPYCPGPRAGDWSEAFKTNFSSSRALHCLSHGNPMPSIENAGQYYGYVDEGDQGVNDARWFHNENVLVTASGNGSIGLWDVSLGKPCVQHLKSHSRCINALAICRDDTYICSGGDDQKVVLYQDVKDPRRCRWRLTLPLCEDVELARRVEIRQAG